MKPLLDIKRKSCYNHYLSTYHVSVYYINKYIMVMFVYKLLAIRGMATFPLSLGEIQISD